jgi:hypothetical protein
MSAPRRYDRALSRPRDGVTPKKARWSTSCASTTARPARSSPKGCPNVPARKIARSVHEAARDKARAIAKTEAYAVSYRERKKVEMLFAHLKRILRLGRLRLRGPSRTKDEFLLGRKLTNVGVGILESARV